VELDITIHKEGLWSYQTSWHTCRKNCYSRLEVLHPMWQRFAWFAGYIIS